MSGKTIIGAVIAAVIVYVWYMISWMVLPWHTATIHKATNEPALQAALMANAPETKIYVVPSPDPEAEEPEMPADFFFIAARRHEMSMGAMMGFGFLGDLVAAIVVALLLTRSGAKTFIGKVAFVKFIAFGAWVMCLWPYYVWWSFEPWFMLVGFLDVMIAWGLAGSVLAVTCKTAGEPAAGAA